MKIINGIFYFFDKLEDYLRGSLSRHPFVYTFIGGIGVVLFWRGVWHTADVLETTGGWNSIIFSSFGSIITGLIILLATGLFVSMFIGDSIIMSGIKKDKKVIDKTSGEVEIEKTDIEKVLEMTQEMKNEIEILEEKIEDANNLK
jgi:hypothetical protein